MRAVIHHTPDAFDAVTYDIAVCALMFDDRDVDGEQARARATLDART